MSEEDPKNINYIIHNTDEKLHKSPNLKIFSTQSNSAHELMNELLETGAGFVMNKITIYLYSHLYGGLMQFRFSTQSLMPISGQIFRIMKHMPWLERYQLSIMRVQQGGHFGKRNRFRSKTDKKVYYQRSFRSCTIKDTEIRSQYQSKFSL